MPTRNTTMYVIFVASLGLWGCQTSVPNRCEAVAETPMLLEGLQAVLREEAGDLTGRNGQWQFVFEGVPMLLLTDISHDRMRIVARIVGDDDVTPLQRQLMLEANFHTALDARYSTSHGTVYAAYIHPLSPLEKEELRSALTQVAMLVKTFGTTYSSTDLRFSGPDDQQGRSRPSAGGQTL